MKNKHLKTTIAAALVVFGIILFFVNSQTADVLAGAFCGVGLTLFLTRRAKAEPTRRGSTTGIAAQERPTGNRLHEKGGSCIIEETASVQASPLGSEYRRKQWAQTEDTVDEILDTFIAVIGSRLQQYCTIAIFFPSPIDDSYALRRYVSKTEFVDPNALIIPRRGILGSLVTEGLRTFYEPNFMNKNATLYYYDEERDFKPEENIRSVMVSPIEADGESKGILLADSVKENAFSENDLPFFENIAKLIGQTVYHAYRSTKHNLDYMRLAAVSNIEKDFWKELEFDAVMEKMCGIIPCIVPCDRLTISLKNEDDMSASVVRALGENSEGFHKLKFRLGGENSISIASLAYSNEFGFFRNFNEDRDECRYTEDEPKSRGFGSFMVVPFGVDKLRGLIMVESAKKDTFTNFNVDLISRMGTSAGLALEKIFIIQKAESLATHDGLTGLYNHRHFQKILATKISACARYQEQLSLVLCDIDFFKKLNDNYGHPFGDVVLKGVAAKLESLIRVDIDAVARYGGEEFVLIFDKTDSNTAKELVERIRQAVHEMIFKTTAGEEVKTSMSFGIASYPHHAREINELISKADKALYSAKQNGRNRVEIY